MFMLPLTVAEYFAGIGLMRLGLDQAGWQTVFANDIDEKKHEMYCHHFGPSPEFLLGDIHTLDEAIVPSTILATASFPCNDLSLAGARKGLAGEHSSAFWGSFVFSKKWAHVVRRLFSWRMSPVFLPRMTARISTKRYAINQSWLTPSTPKHCVT